MSRWKPFVPSFDAVSKIAGIPLPQAMKEVMEVVHRSVEQGPMKNVINELFVFAAELEWHKRGRPAYRVSKQLASALMETSLDLDASHIRFPHPVFSLELPRNLEILNQTGGRLEALLISSTYMDAVPPDPRGPSDQRAILPRVPDPDHGEWTLNVTQRWADDEESNNNMLLRMNPGQTVNDRLLSAITSDDELRARDPRPGVTSNEVTRRIISLAIGAGLFAIGANRRYVKRVVPRGKKRKRRRAKEETSSRHQWILGADIQLPRAGGNKSESSDGEGEGRSLTFSHWRQGHLRLQPSGPKDKQEYSLKYIAPAKIRPDLPPSPMTTRHAMHRGDK